MSKPEKHTIYIDVDDEITSIVEKVHDSKSKILALVLPKRAAVLQSTVNMRLLKRAAEETKKSIVLITSESALLPMAGAVGLHVAKTLQTKPVIPPAPELKSSTLTINDSSDDLENIDPQTPIGKLAGDDEPEETIDVDNTDKPQDDKESKKKAAANKKLKVPNFERFRLWIMLGGALLVLLIIGSIWAFYVAPKAKITLKTDTTPVTSTFDLTASPDTKTLDKDKRIVPATVKQVQKTDSQQAGATGQKDNGTKASGTMTLTNCINDGQSHTVPSGTTFSSNQLNFVTTQDVTLDPALYSGSSCKSANFGLSKDIGVSAAQGGDKYNLSARSYTSSISGITAGGTAMTGGTSKIVKVVSQQDFDTAKQQLLDKTKTAANSDLTKQLKDADSFALSDSITATDQSITATPNVGEEADQTTVTAKVTYTMTGLAQSDLKQLIEADVKQKIDPTKQQIQDKDDGLSKATVKLQDKKANGEIPVNLQVQITAGPQLDADAIKKELVSKKTGDALDAIRQRPGVKDVTIKYSPFWVTTAPKKASKITVLFEQADGSK